jgi:hypothetical protein
MFDQALDDPLRWQELEQHAAVHCLGPDEDEAGIFTGVVATVVGQHLKGAGRLR